MTNPKPKNRIQQISEMFKRVGGYFRSNLPFTITLVLLIITASVLGVKQYHEVKAEIAVQISAEYEDAQAATVIRPGGTQSNNGGYGVYNPWFEYDAQEKLYYRFQDGKEQIDERTGEQLAVSNVILQYCHGEVRDSHDYLAFGVHGVGTALVFTNGKVIPASWSRMEGDGVPAKFYDADGNEIVFNQGKTWICNIWEEYSEYVEFE